MSGSSHGKFRQYYFKKKYYSIKVVKSIRTQQCHLGSGRDAEIPRTKEGCSETGMLTFSRSGNSSQASFKNTERPKHALQSKCDSSVRLSAT